MLYQLAYNLKVPILCRHVQRDNKRPRSILNSQQRVCVRTEQHFDRNYLVVLSGPRRTAASLQVTAVDFRRCVNHGTHHPHVPFVRSQPKRCGAKSVRRFQVCSCLHQHLAYGEVPYCGRVQSAVALFFDELALLSRILTAPGWPKKEATMRGVQPSSSPSSMSIDPSDSRARPSVEP